MGEYGAPNREASERAKQLGEQAFLERELADSVRENFKGNDVVLLAERWTEMFEWRGDSLVLKPQMAGAVELPPLKAEGLAKALISGNLESHGTTDVQVVGSYLVSNGKKVVSKVELGGDSGNMADLLVASGVRLGLSQADMRRAVDRYIAQIAAIDTSLADARLEAKRRARFEHYRHSAAPFVQEKLRTIEDANAKVSKTETSVGQAERVMTEVDKLLDRVGQNAITKTELVAQLKKFRTNAIGLTHPDVVRSLPQRDQRILSDMMGIILKMISKIDLLTK